MMRASVEDRIQEVHDAVSLPEYESQRRIESLSNISSRLSPKRRSGKKLHAVRLDNGEVIEDPASMAEQLTAWWQRVFSETTTDESKREAFLKTHTFAVSLPTLYGNYPLTSS
jgi:hypothetical protein